ncbi:hypothetical protein [Vibrio campbellii]|uniref:hypothetical protein n=1 Tax=Vibrio campbellii TaxID=680 RepID=UPI0018F856A0|nr:hypothetical protein [Vibrio campbellii]
MWIGNKGSIFAQRASEIRYCVELIYSISIGANLTQTTPIEIGSKKLLGEAISRNTSGVCTEVKLHGGSIDFGIRTINVHTSKLIEITCLEHDSVKIQRMMDNFFIKSEPIVTTQESSIYCRYGLSLEDANKLIAYLLVKSD